MKYRNKYTGHLFEIEWLQVADLPVAVLCQVGEGMPLTTARCSHGLAEDFEPIEDDEVQR